MPPTIYTTGLKIEHDRIWLLDQQTLPHQEHWFDATEPELMIAAIKALKTRGAPLIGVSAALCLGWYSQDHTRSEVEQLAIQLKASRPTAVNLMWAIDRLLQYPMAEIKAEALAILHEDIKLCERMGTNGAELIRDGDRILTHCNTGGLATAGIGTALGVIRTAWEQGKKIHVYVDETRPLLQGGRLTTWELQQAGIPYTLITDNMAAMLMQQKRIDKVFLGADRVARNGDFANKIGTYSVAVNAHYHQVPFYPVAPYSTIDLQCLTGQDIPIEERAAEEVKGYSHTQWAPAEAVTYNPAFDVTPAQLVTALVTDRGVVTRMQLQSGFLELL
jgi:methylthioribose-1-phosphate isomerase